MRGMNLNLTWDLFIIVFFGVVIAYSFIIGRNQTLKVITATYVGILCGDALGNLFHRYLASSESFLKFLKLLAISNGEQATAFFKVLILITFVVIIAVRGIYSFNSQDKRPLSMRLAVSGVLGLFSAGLMMGAILIFVSGSSLVTGASVGVNPLFEIYDQSRLVRIMLDYANFWFFLPGVALILISVFYEKDEAPA